MKTLVSLLAISLLLAGCAIHTPGGSVVLDPGVRSGGGGVHCPPGQAKKGNC
jgi:hypothetical protein